MPEVAPVGVQHTAALVLDRGSSRAAQLPRVLVDRPRMLNHDDVPGHVQNE